MKPDVVTYTTLLKYFVQVGDDSATQWVIAELETDPQVVEDVGVYNCLINAYARQGDMCRAVETLEGMKAKNITPNVSTYGSILEGYIRLGNVGEAFKVYNLCVKSAGLAPDARMRKSLIYGCGLHGMSDIAECVIADLQAAGGASAKESRTLRFVLKAAVEAKSEGVAGRVNPRRRATKSRELRRRAAESAITTDGVLSTSTEFDLASDDDPCPVQETPVEWNRGLEMWKYWLGLPNSYYEAAANDPDVASGVANEPRFSSDKP